MDIDRRAFLATSAVSSVLSGPLFGATGPVFTPEQFGARGDGATNDTAAFNRMSQEIQRQGSGTISLRAGRTYIVGAQSRGGTPPAWRADPVIHLDRLNGPLRILGNGARLRAQSGLRFGTFALDTGAPVYHPMPNLDRRDLVGLFRGMIWISNCAGPVEVRDIELDGNLDKLMIGGKWGDTGWQIAATGLLLQSNRGTETIVNVLSHHHGQDGAMIMGDESRTARSRFSHFVSRYNGRQGLSLTGGRGYDFADCEFSHTGRAGLHSAPGAGVDIEAEGTSIRDVTFTRCRFVDNVGCGMVADSGDSEGVRFTGCTFVGTTSWSAWPKKPGFSFAGCTFVGSVVHAFPAQEPGRAVHFTNCRFTDDPKLSPTGQVYSGKRDGGPIADINPSDNVSFDGCTFDLVGAALLPWTTRAIYRDCVMRQRSPNPSYPRGRYLGRTTITGNAQLAASTIEGTVILNGRTVTH